MEEFIRLQAETGSLRLPKVCPNVQNLDRDLKLIVSCHRLITSTSLPKNLLFVKPCILRRQALLGQLMDGLKSLGFLDVMKKIPSTFEPLFIHQNKALDGPTLISTIVPANLSPEKEAGMEMLHQFIMEAPEAGQLI